MEWIKCSETLPTERCKFIASIDGRLFFGEVRYENNGVFFHEPNYLVFFLPGIGFEASGYWSIPKHFKEPTHWMPLPSPPKDLNNLT